ncbi:MAG: DUF4439 domain-containing protein [Nocardioidaceae bacterium]
MTAEATDGWQQCLAAEHAASWAYGVLGGVLAGAGDRGEADLGLASSASDEHLRRRNQLTARIRALDAEPAVADAAYTLPFQVADARAARRLAVLVERRCTVVYAGAVAVVAGGDRRFMAEALAAYAVLEVRWGGRDRELPGLTS